jgi:hypothetical protein
VKATKIGIRTLVDYVVWLKDRQHQLCYPHLQHLVEVQLVLDCHCEVVHLTLDAFQDPVSGK